MKKKFKCVNDEIKGLINNSFIPYPSNYEFTSSSAKIYLNKCVVSIRRIFSRVSYLFSTSFGFDTNDLYEWSTKFDKYVSSNQVSINKMEHYCLTDTYCSLDSNSTEFFNRFIDGVNSLLNEFAHLCSLKFAKTKYEPTDNTIFVVHGHNEKLKKYLSTKLSSKGYNPIVLSSKNDTGISLFDKFEKYANKCVKALILITKDDQISNGDNAYYQGRPNVYIEYGYFLHMLNKRDIVVVHEKGCGTPSDISGISYIEFDGDLRAVLSKVLDALAIS